MTKRPHFPQQTRILIVDDVPELRRLTRLQLSTRPNTEIVGEAADGIEAIQRSCDLQPDLVICDIAMPHLDGIDALPRIRAAAPCARVLVLSWYSDAPTIRRAMSAGARGFAVKGKGRQDLLDQVDFVLGAR